HVVSVIHTPRLLRPLLQGSGGYQVRDRVLWTKRKVRPASNLRADWRHRCRRADATEGDIEWSPRSALIEIGQESSTVQIHVPIPQYRRAECKRYSILIGIPFSMRPAPASALNQESGEERFPASPPVVFLCSRERRRRIDVPI